MAAYTPACSPLNPRVVRKYKALGQELPPRLIETRFAAEGAKALGPQPQTLRAGQPLRALVLLVKFTDQPPGGPTTRFSPTVWDNLVFGTSYSRGGIDTSTTRTLKNYYAGVSYGAVDLVTVNLPSTLGWLTMPNAYGYYCPSDGNNSRGPYPNNAQRLVMDAVLAADPIVDFSQYAVGGVVQNLIIVPAGGDAAWAGSQILFWSHQGNITTPYAGGAPPPPLFADGVRIDRYALIPEAYGDTTGEIGPPMTPLLPTVGAFAHEFGHLLGMVDEYDWGYESNGVGDLSVMSDGGQWNYHPIVPADSTCDGNCPARPSAWGMIRMGFVVPVTVNWPMVGVTIPPIEMTPTNAVYKLLHPGSNGQEYWLLENRQQIGFDRGLLRMGTLDAHGLVIYHVDEHILQRVAMGPNSAECVASGSYQGQTNCNCAALPPDPLNGERWYAIAVEQADGQYDMELGANFGDQYDFFTSRYGTTSFGPATNPNSTSYYSRYGCMGLVSATNIVETGQNITLNMTPGMGFADINAGLTPSYGGAMAWGDYDNDGDLDVLVTGTAGFSGSAYSRIFRNDNGVFTDLQAGLPALAQSAAAWGDYDGDGDLDFVLAGYYPGYGYVSRIYRNNGGGSFTNINAGLPGAGWSSAAWGDYDNDGDLDLLLAGIYTSVADTRIYRNNGNGNFTNAAAGLPGVERGGVAWVDYDNDGDLDVALTGSYVSRIYRNTGGVFADAALGLPGLSYSNLDFGDYDNDGDQDLALMGWTGGACFTAVYRNESGASFTNIGAPLSPTRLGSIKWGDYDNDGDADLLLTGLTDAGPASKMYRNDAGSFVATSMPLVAVEYSKAAWGDYDSDGDLDFLLGGGKADGAGYGAVYGADGAPVNSPPTPPSALVSNVSGSTIALSWTGASDAETPSSGLSYNLRVGTTPGGCEVVSAMASFSGVRRVAQPGNAQERTTWYLNLPNAGVYYWSVQAIDGGFRASEFAPEQSFRVMTAADANAGLQEVNHGGGEWGDYDSDGDLDIVLVGWTGAEYLGRIYRNDGAGGFTDINASLPALYGGSVAWGDYDNDGNLDLALMGQDTHYVTSAWIHHNDGGGVFHDINAGLSGYGGGGVAWADYDNDGDLDLLLWGCCDGAKLFRNDGGVFTSVAAGFGVSAGFQGAAWGDYDNDGDLDLALAGVGPSRIYRNDQGTFQDIGAGLPSLWIGAVAWGDYDGDGDLDLLLAGTTDGTQSGGTTRLYRNTGGTFADANVSLPGLSQCAVRWGDFDNDGDLDIALSGLGTAGAVTGILRNTGGTFANFIVSLPGVSGSTLSVGDCDNDGDLDLLLTGTAGTGRIAQVWRVAGAPPNQPPSAPTRLDSSVDGDWATLSWDRASDGKSLSDLLTYNVRIGTTPGGGEVVTPLADALTGYRRVAQAGNAQQRTSWTIRLPGVGQYFWSVQAVDAAFAGGPFAPERILLRPTGVGQTPPSRDFSLGNAIPNPFNPATSMTYFLPRPEHVRIQVFDAAGRRVRVLVDEQMVAGDHTVRWDGTSDHHQAVAAGPYFCWMKAGPFNATRRMTLIK